MNAFMGLLTCLVAFLHCVASEYGVRELGLTISDPNDDEDDDDDSGAATDAEVAVVTTLSLVPVRFPPMPVNGAQYPLSGDIGGSASESKLLPALLDCDHDGLGDTGIL